MRRVAMAVVVFVGSAQAAPDREVLARGKRVVALDGGAVVVTRPDGKGAPLVVARPARERKVTAKVAAFLGDGKLLDVTVTESSERGWSHERRDTHYLVDISQPADAIACVFDGASSDGGEYASNVTTAVVKRAARAPLAFDVTRTTRSTATQPQPPPPPSTTSAVQRYELGADSCKRGTP